MTLADWDCFRLNSTELKVNNRKDDNKFGGWTSVEFSGNLMAGGWLSAFKLGAPPPRTRPWLKNRQRPSKYTKVCTKMDVTIAGRIDAKSTRLNLLLIQIMSKKRLRMISLFLNAFMLTSTLKYEYQ